MAPRVKISRHRLLLHLFLHLAAMVGGFTIGWFWVAPPSQPKQDQLHSTKSRAKPSHKTSTSVPTRTDLSLVSAPATFLGVPNDRFDFQYFRGESGDYWLPETMGGGIAWIDYDGDGLHDLYCVQGAQLGHDLSGGPVNQLFRQGPDGSWLQAPSWAAAADSNYGMGVAVGDFNNDGFDDLLVTNYGPSLLYQNNGDGTFFLHATWHDPGQWGTSSAFGDLDGDGDLDIYIAHYLHFEPDQICKDSKSNQRNYCGPDYFEADQDRLLKNGGEGFFEDITAGSGIVQDDGKGLGVIVADLIDDDGIPEIFVANDLKPNFLFRNSKKGLIEYSEEAFQLGAAVNGEGVREANMGIACGDYDQSGTLDLYVTHYYMEQDTLWRNLGAHGFDDATRATGLSLNTLTQLSWGTNFIDYNNDGWLDLFVTSGHVNNYTNSTTPYEMRPQLFFNAGRQTKNVRFVDTTFKAGSYFEQVYVGRGSCMSDFDMDGDWDLAVGHHDKPYAVLTNETRGLGNAIGLRLSGVWSNRDAVGTRVVFSIRELDGSLRSVTREIVGGGSYLSADSKQVLVGIGPAQSAEEIHIRWASGRTDVLRDISAGSYYKVIEGRPITVVGRFETHPQESE